MMKVTLVSYTPDPIMAMAKAASVCYDSEPSITVVKKCIERGHHSITEFADFHFFVDGLSRAASHQLVRHRLASYAQRSQRYVDESGFDFVIPPSLEHNLEARYVYERIMQVIDAGYRTLIELGIPKEDARFILPNAATTQIHVKMNFRELMHFCRERLCSRAQWEIRELAKCMKEEIAKVAPELAEYLRPKCEWLGHCPEGVNGCGR